MLFWVMQQVFVTGVCGQVLLHFYSNRTTLKLCEYCTKMSVTVTGKYLFLIVSILGPFSLPVPQQTEALASC